MEYDYDAYLRRFDLSTTKGIRTFIEAALNDWRNDEVTDEQFDDLIAHSVVCLAGR